MVEPEVLLRPLTTEDIDMDIVEESTGRKARVAYFMGDHTVLYTPDKYEMIIFTRDWMVSKGGKLYKVMESDPDVVKFRERAEQYALSQLDKW